MDSLLCTPQRFGNAQNTPASPFIAVDDFLRLCAGTAWISEDSSDSGSECLSATCFELLALQVPAFVGHIDRLKGSKTMPAPCSAIRPMPPLATPSTAAPSYPRSFARTSLGEHSIQGLVTPAAPAPNRALTARPVAPSSAVRPVPRASAKPSCKPVQHPPQQAPSALKGIPSRLGLASKGVTKQSKSLSGIILPFQFVKPCGYDGRMTLEALNAKLRDLEEAAKRANSAPLPPPNRPQLLKRKATI